MQAFRTLLVVVSLLGAWDVGGLSVGAAAREDGPIGKKIENFSLQDFRGKAHSLDDCSQAKLVVVAFLGTECPLGKLYAPRLAELAERVRPQGRGLPGHRSPTGRTRSPRWPPTPACTTSSSRC